MKKIVVTGGKGFIGSHLVQMLEKMNYDVDTYDIKDGKDVRTMVPEDLAGVEYVFHMAAQISVPESIEHPVDYNSHNIDGTLNVLWCAKEAGVKRVIFSSSCAVYGNNGFDTFFEDMKTCPASPYALQKLAGEMYCKLFTELYGLHTVILRYFNVFGERMPEKNQYGSCISNFLKAKRELKPVYIYGSGKQLRDFVHVQDVCDANFRAALSNRVNPGEIINVCSGKSMSVLDIATTIDPILMRFLDRRDGDLFAVKGVNIKAETLLGWRPTVDVINWLKQNVESR